MFSCLLGHILTVLTRQTGDQIIGTPSSLNAWDAGTVRGQRGSMWEECGNCVVTRVFGPTD